MRALSLGGLNYQLSIGFRRAYKIQRLDSSQKCETQPWSSLPVLSETVSAQVGSYVDDADVLVQHHLDPVAVQFVRHSHLQRVL